MLNAKQKKCVELLATGEYTQKEIAKELNVTEATICNWKKINEFNVEYAETLKQNISSVAAKAFKTEVALLSARSEMVRLMAAKDILDRAGFKADENVNINGVGKVVIIDDCDQ